ncbi:hypothetical protein [uncultured Faecalibaculum sp.]|uniref:hypothetical protein n=1 Tax=uncultured Faecalibaculum sp. TaxID=1729681 RepID=UPI00262E0E27|nr:hypothetical protein [uncultured Faecalibaculum sp.]
MSGTRQQFFDFLFSFLRPSIAKPTVTGQPQRAALTSARGESALQVPSEPLSYEVTLQPLIKTEKGATG